MSKWILIVIYDINIWLHITPPLHQRLSRFIGIGLSGWQCRAWLRNDSPCTAKKIFKFTLDPPERKAANR
jgi:hypothetical protein